MNDIVKPARKEERDGVLRITLAPEPAGMVTDFEIHPKDIRKLIETLERALGDDGRPRE